MNLRKIISFLLFIGLVGLSFAYYIQHKDDLHILSTLSTFAFLMVVILSLLLFLLYGLQFKILTDHHNLNLKFSQWFGLLRMSTFTNLWIPFGGGASVKAVYLRKFHDLRYSSFIASQGMANMIKMLLNSLFAFMLLSGVRTHASTLLFITAGSIFIGCVLFLFSFSKRTKLFLSLKYVRNVFERWQIMRKDVKTVKKLIYITCVIFALTSLKVFLSFRAFSVDISLLTCGVISAFTTMSSVLNLLPGNFGIKEAMVIVIAGTDGIGVNEGLHAAALGRITSTILTLIFVPFFSSSFLRKSKEEIIYP